MNYRHYLKVAAGGLGVLTTLAAHASVIDFENFIGPSTYAAAGVPRDLSVAILDANNTVINTVGITGGTVLSQRRFSRRIERRYTARRFSAPVTRLVLRIRT